MAIAFSYRKYKAKVSTSIGPFYEDINEYTQQNSNPVYEQLHITHKEQDSMFKVVHNECYGTSTI